MKKTSRNSNRTSNDRIKHRYFHYLRDADGRDEATIDGVSKSLARFETYTSRRDFQKFHIEQARGFKRYLAEQRNARTGQPLSKATAHATLGHLKRFFHWLADQPGYRSRIHHADVEYFSSSEKDARIATAAREPRSPTLEQIKHVVSKMPSRTDIERRNRALIAFTAVTGARDRAIASMKLKHVDLSEGCIHQDAREVRTKFAKTFDTFFLPVWKEGRQIVEDWVEWLRTQLLFGNEDPLFPATRMELDENRRFVAAGVDKSPWSDAGPIRRIFRDAFKAAGLPYYNPHSLRHMLALRGEKWCRTPEDFKAWSQNMGHEKVLTTFNCYGPVSHRRQGEILRARPADE